jgi:hypothetical protein
VAQVYQLRERVGAGWCTLAVDDLEALIAHLDRLGIDLSEQNSGARFRTVMITDPMAIISRLRRRPARRWRADTA